ncbi:hypothetical protein [Nocardia sp. NBC_01327]|uniref:hypothetical protein n=1 Tax=Nocardia sp. NBC_01327 TaxID=2903593 RepID=UPI002E0EEFB8|nr:hypothetical protein OG326_41720 [Nocardia sp. NBC_01327]
MVEPTPSLPARVHPGHDPHPSSTRPIKEAGPYIAVAVGSSVLFFLLFQPWMTASGRDGSATVNAFGRIKHTTRHLNLWSESPPSNAEIDSVWAVLAIVAILIAVIAAIQTILHRSEAAETITAVATLAVAVLVLIDVHNLDSNIPQVRDSLGMNTDLSSQLGLAIGALRGTSDYPWPGHEVMLAPSELTPWAFASTAIAIVSAAVAAMRSWQSILRGITAVAARLV